LPDAEDVVQEVLVHAYVERAIVRSAASVSIPLIAVAPITNGEAEKI